MPPNYLHLYVAQDLISPLILDDFLCALDHLVYLVFEGLERVLLVEAHDTQFKFGGIIPTGFWRRTDRPTQFQCNFCGNIIVRL